MSASSCHAGAVHLSVVRSGSVFGWKKSCWCVCALIDQLFFQGRTEKSFIHSPTSTPSCTDAVEWGVGYVALTGTFCRGLNCKVEKKRTCWKVWNLVQKKLCDWVLQQLWLKQLNMMETQLLPTSAVDKNTKIHSAGVAAASELTWKIWKLFYVRCTSWHILGSNLRPQENKKWPPSYHSPGIRCILIYL